MIWMVSAMVFLVLASGVNIWLAASSLRQKLWVRITIPVLFGLVIIALWEGTVRGLEISPILLPAPSIIALKFATTTDILWKDFVQTAIKGGLSGYIIGCTAAFTTAVLIDRSSFLQRGLMPIGNLVAALPIVGIAPILVKWYGFGWESKSAVVVVMVFFPMLVNTVQGLRESNAIQNDLMRTYAAGYWQSLLKLRLPAAMPFIFNGLKIGTTLALIGAIVAEYFGSPIYGMGFRIQSEAGRLALDMVWAEIAMAALAGSTFYGSVVIIEKAVTFWHPSQRG